MSNANDRYRDPAALARLRTKDRGLSPEQRERFSDIMEKEFWEDVEAKRLGDDGKYYIFSYLYDFRHNNSTVGAKLIEDGPFVKRLLEQEAPDESA